MDKKVPEESCEKVNCAHFLERNKYQHYRGRFIWIVIGATVAVGILFAIIAYFYKCSLQEVVSLHQMYQKEIQKSLRSFEQKEDGCVYVNEQLALSMQEHMQSTQTLLQVQSQKIQSDFTILSVWAGILMIVFLVFSIYSMFKTDELVKQGRAGLDAIENAREKVSEHIAKIDTHVENELKKVSAEAKKQSEDITNNALASLTEVKNQAEKEKANFKQVVEEKTNEFQKIYGNYVSMLNSAGRQNDNILNTLMEALQNKLNDGKSDGEDSGKEGGTS